MRYTVSALILMCTLALQTGCGQTGPLYLPGQEPSSEKPDERKQVPVSR
jgi:predicted small lipoprotein YifL